MLRVIKEDGDTLLSRVEDALKSDPLTTRMVINATFSGGVVELRGSVRSYYLKQMVQEVILRSLKRDSGKPFLRNLLEVILTTDQCHDDRDPSIFVPAPTRGQHSAGRPRLLRGNTQLGSSTEV